MEKIYMEEANSERAFYQPQDLVLYANIFISPKSGLLKDYSYEVFEEGEEANGIPIFCCRGDGFPAWEAALPCLNTLLPVQAYSVQNIKEVLETWFLSCGNSYNLGRFLLHFKIHNGTARS